MASRKCSVCKTKHDVSELSFSGIKCYCSPECGAKLAMMMLDKKKAEKNKAGRARDKKRLEILNDTAKYWIPKAQAAFNKFIRLRDAKDACISCGNYSSSNNHGGTYDCGHYRSVGSCPELRFEPLNAHKQCKKCNNYLSGNVVEYRLRLQKKLTPEQLAFVEGPHEPKRYRVSELKEIHAHYTKLCKELEREQC